MALPPNFKPGFPPNYIPCQPTPMSVKNADKWISHPNWGFFTKSRLNDEFRNLTLSPTDSDAMVEIGMNMEANYGRSAINAEFTIK